MLEVYKGGVDVRIKSQFSWTLLLKYQKENQVNPISREQSFLLQQAQHWNGSSRLKGKLVSGWNQGRPDFEEGWLPSMIDIPLTVGAVCGDKPPKLFITSKYIWCSMQTLKSSSVSSVWEGLETILWWTASPRGTQNKGYNCRFETDK